MTARLRYCRRIITASLGVACFALAIALHRIPTPSQAPGSPTAGREQFLVSLRLDAGLPDDESSATETDCIPIRKLIDALYAQALWTRSGEHLFGRYHGEFAIDQIEQVLSSFANAPSWFGGDGTSGNVVDLGDVLLVTQTRKNLAAIRSLLDAIGQCTTSAEPLVLEKRVSAGATDQPDDAIHVINVNSLLRKVRLPAELGGDAIDSVDLLPIVDDLEDLVCDAINPPPAMGTYPTRIQPLACGSLLIFRTSHQRGRDVQAILHAIDRASSAGDLNPVFAGLPPSCDAVRAPFRLACFNVRAIRQHAHMRRVPPVDPLQAYMVQHTSDVPWTKVGDGQMYSIGNVLAVILTPDGIEAVHQSLIELDRRLPGNGASK